MHKEVKILSIARSKYFGLDEQGLMALLLVAVVIQVACAFSASANLVRDDAPGASIVQLHGATMLAKK